MSRKSKMMSSLASQIRSLWKPDPYSILRPPKDEFYISEETWVQTLLAMIHGMPLLITGPAGSGKTELLYRAAKALRRHLAPYNFGAMTEPRSSLIGVTHFDPNQGTIFQESRFVRELRKPYTVMLLDEINRASHEAQNILVTLLDDQRYISLDESEDINIVHPAEGVCFAATANIGAEYAGTNEFDWAIQNRFQIVIQMNFLYAQQEANVLKKRYPGIQSNDAMRFCRTAERQRTMHRDGEFSTPISTRSLLAAAKQCAAGIPVDMAFKFCVLNQFSGIGGVVSDREKLAEIWRFSSIEKRAG